MTFNVLKGKKINDPGLIAFADLVKRHKIPEDEISSFFTSLELDYENNSYKTFKDLRAFTYGVAEVVGLMMAHVMDLSPASFEAAQQLGLAMQLVNILRDIKEDNERGKTYIPQADLKKYGLASSLSESNIIQNSKEYNKMMMFEIQRTREILQKARQGFYHIPKRIRLSIQIAADIYERYLDLLEKKPAQQYSLTIRPSYYTIMMIAIKNYIALYVHN
jgi:phytoene synthase